MLQSVVHSYRHEPLPQIQLRRVSVQVFEAQRVVVQDCASQKGSPRSNNTPAQKVQYAYLNAKEETPRSPNWLQVPELSPAGSGGRKSFLLPSTTAQYDKLRSISSVLAYPKHVSSPFLERGFQPCRSSGYGPTGSSCPSCSKSEEEQHKASSSARADADPISTVMRKSRQPPLPTSPPLL
uniref:Uncharacterized protein n=1 Tax=Ditylenchus dipsaci TaxID=166011 RepID=A0A915E0X1_9BILA